jgi:DNA-binding transcriptional LysR family regulator
MTIDQLLAFKAVASLGTFAAAAAALHKSQPAISKLVQNLEAELGISLFDRSAYRATLTDTGKLFLERAAEVVASTESLHSFGLALGRGGEPVVRLVLDAVTPLEPVLLVLRDVQSLFPAVRYELRTERLAGAIEALRDASADLAIASRHGMDARIMTAQRFMGVRIVPVVSRSHPLAAVGGPAPATLLRKHPQVVLRDSARGDLTHTLNVLEGGLRWTVTDVASKLQIIEAGMGWGGLPEHIVAPGLRNGTLVELTVRQFDVGVIELFALRRHDRRAGPVAQALWARLRR